MGLLIVPTPGSLYVMCVRCLEVPVVQKMYSEFAIVHVREHRHILRGRHILTLERGFTLSSIV